MQWTDREMMRDSDLVTYNDMGKQNDLYVHSTCKNLESFKHFPALKAVL